MNCAVFVFIAGCVMFGAVSPSPVDYRTGGDDGAYTSVQLTDDSRTPAPPWPAPRTDEEMFVLPRKLNSGDKISVSGSFRSNPQRLAVNLVTGYSSPDYQNVACRVDVQFTPGDRIMLQVTQNGNTEAIAGDFQDIPASEWFSDNNFYFRFDLRVSNSYAGQQHSVAISIGEAHLEELRLKHRIEDIRFLTLEGDIEKVRKLDFEFA